LDRTRNILHGSAGYCAEIGGRDGNAGEPILHVIEGVKEIRSHSKLLILPWQHESFHEAKINVHQINYLIAGAVFY
jgi:hypothetical protein